MLLAGLEIEHHADRDRPVIPLDERRWHRTPRGWLPLRDEDHAAAEIPLLVIGLAAAPARPNIGSFDLRDGEALIEMPLARLEVEHHAERDRPVINSAR